MKNLTDSVVLVTGAASGMGKSAALTFANMGSKIIATDINGEGLKETKQLLDDMNAESTIMTADIANSDAVKEMTDMVIEKYGAPDVILNVAGICAMGEFIHMPLEDIKRIVDVNLLGQIYTTHYLLPEMAKKKSGHIVNVASAAGLYPVACLSAYNASKYGLVGFSEAISHELNDYGIRVTTICPGGTDTGMIDSIGVHGFSKEKIDKYKGVLRPFLTDPQVLADMMVESVVEEREGIYPTKGTGVLHYIAKYMQRLYRFLIKSMKKFMVFVR